MTAAYLADQAVALPQVVARRVRGMAAEQGLTQADIGAILGVSRSGVSDRMRGKMEFALSELPLLASRLGVSIEYLLGLTDERGPRRTVSVEGLAGDRYAIRDSNPEPADSEHPALRLVSLADVIRFPVERRRAA